MLGKLIFDEHMTKSHLNALIKVALALDDNDLNENFPFLNTKTHFSHIHSQSDSNK